VLSGDEDGEKSVKQTDILILKYIYINKRTDDIPNEAAKLRILNYILWLQRTHFCWVLKLFRDYNLFRRNLYHIMLYFILFILYFILYKYYIF